MERHSLSVSHKRHEVTTPDTAETPSTKAFAKCFSSLMLLFHSRVTAGGNFFTVEHISHMGDNLHQIFPSDIEEPCTKTQAPPFDIPRLLRLFEHSLEWDVIDVVKIARKEDLVASITLRSTPSLSFLLTAPSHRGSGIALSRASGKFVAIVCRRDGREFQSAHSRQWDNFMKYVSNKFNNLTANSQTGMLMYVLQIRKSQAKPDHSTFNYPSTTSAKGIRPNMCLSNKVTGKENEKHFSGNLRVESTEETVVNTSSGDGVQTTPLSPFVIQPESVEGKTQSQ